MGNKRRCHRPERVISGSELQELLAELERSPVGARFLMFDGDLPPRAQPTESGARGV